MAIAYLVGNAKNLGAAGGTSDALDTTGADFLVAIVGRYNAGGSTTPTDSKGNSWTGLTEEGGSTYAAVRIFYSIPSSVGSGHTVTYSAGGSYSSISFLAFSGVAQSSAFDVENRASGSGTSLNTGSVTPGQDDSLFVTGFGESFGGSSGYALDLGFTVAGTALYAPGSAQGVGSGYLIQGAAAARNPAWSWMGSNSLSAMIAVFKPAAVASGRIGASLRRVPDFGRMVRGG